MQDKRKEVKKCEEDQKDVWWAVCAVLINALVLLVAGHAFAVCESDIGCNLYYAMQIPTNIP